MSNNWNENKVELCGIAQAAPVFSHKNHDDNYYSFPLRISRLSGATDIVNIIVHEKLLSAYPIAVGAALKVGGEVRTFNNRSGFGSKLVITVFARRMSEADEEQKNKVSLCGTICKQPILRKTPMGRDICDIMLAVNRKYGRADYLPCIAWGQAARDAAMLGTGAKIRLEGRIQSRSYIKVEDGISRAKTAFEVSAMEISLVDLQNGNCP